MKAEKERAIGFLANHGNPGKCRGNGREAEDVLLRFDSGRCITFDDATHHLLALGTTGSGKSASVIFPALYRLIGSGAFGLIIDIKGNFRWVLRPMASSLGREMDILELGTSASAIPINILKGMSRHQMRQFFETLTTQNIKSSQSMDWHMKGVAGAADCGQLLLFLNEKYPNLQPDCRLISEMVNEPDDARKLYRLFKEKVYDGSRLEHRHFLSSIENYRFHILKDVPKTTSSAGTTLDEQLSWGLQGVRDGLRNFINAPGIEKNFCCPGAPGLDLVEPILQGKLIVLRFDLDTGPAGASLARMILSHYYSCIFSLGLHLPKDKKSFVCVDEFQEIADLSSNRLSDSSFIALAREFNCIFMAATQSMSALLAKGADPAAVTSFAANCNQKIILYSDDEMTQAVAAQHDPEVLLTRLNPGEAFAITYDQKNRKHEAGLETLSEAYGSVKEVIKDVQPVVPESGLPNVGEEKSLFELAEWAERELNGKKEEKPEEKEEEKVPEKKAMPQDVMEAVMARRVVEEEREKKRERQQKIRDRKLMKGNCGELVFNFPELFDSDGEEVSFAIPAGWEEFFMKVFHAFKATRLPVKVLDFQLIDGLPKAVGRPNYWGNKNDDGLELLNMMLAGAGNLCVICGYSVTRLAQQGTSPLMCDDCLRKFGLENVPMKRPDANNQTDSKSDSYEEI